MAQHTPGDWQVAPPDGTGEPDSRKQYRGKPYREHCSVHAVHPVRRDRKGVAHVYQGDGEVGSPEAIAEQLANAKLIAAAPDLLDACRAFLCGDHDAAKRALAAVEKATGEKL